MRIYVPLHDHLASLCQRKKKCSVPIIRFLSCFKILKIILVFYTRFVLIFVISYYIRMAFLTVCKLMATFKVLKEVIHVFFFF